MPARPLAPIALALALTLNLTHASAQSSPPAPQLAFELPAGPLESSLTTIARSSGRAIAFDPALTRGLQAPALRGRYTTEQAVQQMLRDTPLQLRISPSGTLIVEARSQSADTRLAELTVTAQASAESAWGPVQGLAARRSASATKTDTALRETPQSISVIGQEEIVSRKHDSLADVLGYTAGLVSQPNGYSRVADDYRLRGFDIGPRTGSVLRDGMKLQSSQFEGGQEPYGLERVEVLKGAASVLYGQLAPGGLINTVSKRPTLEPLHELNLEYGSYDRQQLSTDHSGAIDEDGHLSYRLTALWRESGTQFDAIDDNKEFIAPALSWQISDATRLTLLASHQRTRTTLTPPIRYDLTTYSDTPGYKIPYDLFPGEPDYDDYDGTLQTAGYVLEHRFNEQLQLRHSLRHYNSRSDYDYITLNSSRVTGTKLSLLTRSYNSREDVATGWASDTNLQWDLTSGRWQHTLLAGLDYYHKTYDSHRHSGNAPELDLANPVYGKLPQVNTAVDRGNVQHGRQLGLYFQHQAKFDERWVLVYGLRHDRAEGSTREYRTGVRTETDDAKTTGRVGLVYLADNGLAPYASYSQSFLPTAGTGADGKAFKPTEGEQIEFGLRYQPEGRDMMLSAAVYQLTQRNVLSSIPGSDYDEQTGKERSTGLELEIKTHLSARLALSASYTYTDAHIIEDNDPAVEGTRIEGTPYHSAALWMEYRWPTLGLTLGAGARHTGATRTLASISTRDIPAYTLVDARLGYLLDEHWQLDLKAQNLTNQRYLYCANSCRYGDERSVIASVSYRW